MQKIVPRKFAKNVWSRYLLDLVANWL